MTKFVIKGRHKLDGSAGTYTVHMFDVFKRAHRYMSRLTGSYPNHYFYIEARES